MEMIKAIGARVSLLVTVMLLWPLVSVGDLYAQVILGPDLKIPPYYEPLSETCRPGRGYLFGAKAPNYPRTFPFLNLWVFNGEVIGFVLAVDAKQGWKPWYRQEEGKPTTHGGQTIPHYSQIIFVKEPPTATECKGSRGPYGK
jgi:hypothetical protein